MRKKVYVTTAQREAAQYILKRDAARGRTSDPAIRKIAEARPYSGDNNAAPDDAKSAVGK